MRPIVDDGWMPLTSLDELREGSPIRPPGDGRRRHGSLPDDPPGADVPLLPPGASLASR